MYRRLILNYQTVKINTKDSFIKSSDKKNIVNHHLSFLGSDSSKQVSQTTIWLRNRTKELKAQKTNNVLPKDFIQYTQDFKEKFNLDFEDDEMIDYLIENCILLSKNLDKYAEKHICMLMKLKKDIKSIMQLI